MSVCRSSLFLLIIAEFIVNMSGKSIGKILLLDIMIRIFMGIKIMLSNYFCAVSVKMLILKMTWKIEGIAVSQIIYCSAYSVV